MMNVTVKNVSNTETLIEVQTKNGIKDIKVTKTTSGYSYKDFSDWDISDDEYFDLEELVESVGNRFLGKCSSLNISYKN